MSDQVLLAWATFAVTAVLVLITGYYAWQNKRMVDEIRRQSRPYLYIVHEEHCLVVKNGGTRSAHDIRIRLATDAKVPKQYETFAQVSITREGETSPPQEPSQQLTPEKWAEITQGTVDVSTLPMIKSGIPTLVPGEGRPLAQVVRHIGRKEHQRFVRHDEAPLGTREPAPARH
jgi:hypothetical protein